MAQKALNVIGLMSGTSLDGIDVALLNTDGDTISEFGATYFRPYSTAERQIIEDATQAALSWNFTGVPPNIFQQAEELVDRAHIDAVERFLKENAMDAGDIDIVGYHGQTIIHRPPEDGHAGQTLQLGNGERLASTLKMDTVYDFRTNDMGKGGQGAPLAPVYHAALLKKIGIPLPAAILNIGGVSNITIVRNSGQIIASDCGPGNGPLDSWIAQNGLGDYDENGRISLKGTPDITRVDKWLQRDFFKLSIPKSADRWDFDVLDDLDGFSPENGAATLVAFTALAIADTLKLTGRAVEKIIICGGGRKNPAILGALKEMRMGEIITAEQAGLSGDDIEAQAFAFLAVRSLMDLPLSYPTTTGVIKPVSGGKLAKAP